MAQDIPIDKPFPLKIKEIFLDKNNGEQKILLTFEGKEGIVYVTKGGLQFLPLAWEATHEDANSIFNLIKEFLATIEE